MDNDPESTAKPDVARLVEEHYKPLYRFAFGLSRNPEDALDLTQQTFFLYQTKGGQLRERSKVKSWLYSTLYHQFVDRARKRKRFPKFEFNEEMMPASAESHPKNKIDAKTAVAALGELEEKYRAPLILFYLKSHSYREIADTLEMPIGTVMSRLRRGKDRLRSVLEGETAKPGEFAREPREAGPRREFKPAHV